MLAAETKAADQGPQEALPGARPALMLLLVINLFNFIDRYILAAVIPELKKELFAADDPAMNAKVGLLTTAFMVSYMVLSPLFGWLADRMSRWVLVGSAILVW